MSFCLRPNVCKKCGKPLTMFEGWTCLECENAEQEPCDDAISREDRLIDLANAIESDDSGYWTNKRISSVLRNIPSVTQKCEKCAMNGSGSKYCDNCGPKSGKWIDYSDEGYVECPFCGHATNCEDDIDELHYCFFCGARMESNNNE